MAEVKPLPSADGDTDKKHDDQKLAVIDPELDNKYLTGLLLYAVLASVSLVSFLIMLDMSIIVTAIPRITTQFNSLADVGWYGSSYQLAAASLQPLAGKIYSNYSAKITYLSFFFIFELGSLLCGLSISSNMLIASRAVAGIGASGLINGSLTILSICIPMHKRPMYLGGMMGFAQLGFVLGPLLGGAFTQYATWRWCFYINLPLGGIVATLLLLCRIPQTINRNISVIEVIKSKLDLVGFSLFAPAAIQFFLALDYGGHQYAWNSATVIGLFCGAGSTFIIFLIWEHSKGDNAMIPFFLLKNRIVWSSCIAILFFFGMVQLATFYTPIYFQSVKDTTPILSGVYMLPAIISQLIATVTAGRLGYYLPFIVISSIISSISNGLMATLSPTTSTGKWIGYQIILGVGRGIGFQMPIIAAQNSVPPAFIPITMALVSLSQTFGGAMILAVSETILTNSLYLNMQKYAPDVSPTTIIAAGASGIRDVVTDSTQLAGVLVAYAKAIDNVFFIAVGCSCVIFTTSWCMGWKDIRKH